MYRKFIGLSALLLFTFVSSTAAGSPAITSISPLVGTSSGGTTVTIHGSGFIGTSAVFFGTEAATSFNVVSDAELTAVSPAYIPEVVSLTVTSAGDASTYYVYQGNWQVYVANGSGNTLSVIDPVDNILIGSPISVGDNPCYIAFTPNGTRAFVSNETGGSLTPINVVTNAALSSFPSQGTFPNAMVLAPDSSAVYIANDNDGIVSGIDTTSGSPLWTYSTGGNPSTLAITPGGALLGVTDTATSEVIFLNTTTGLLNNQSSVGVSQDCIVLDSSNTTAYIANNNSGSISVMSPYTGTSATLVTVGNNPTALALTPDSTKLYVVNAADNTVSVINTESNTVTATVSVGVFPKNIMILPDGTKGYVANNTSGTVSIINTSNNSVSTLSTGIESNPYALGFLPDGSKAYVANAGSDSVSIIDTSTDTVLATLAVGLFPCSIAISPDQAPLASFSYQVSGSGQTVTFDASDSASPVGTIASYFWDFGDGSTLETSSATTSHVYTSGGSYEITLTVTNSAGTSTEQIFNRSSSCNFNQTSLTVTQSETVSHNGGPTATTTQSLTLSFNVLPPTNLRGHSIKQRFLSQKDLVNVLEWKAPKEGGAPYRYRIYRDSSLTNLAGTVPADALKFLDHNRRRGVVYTYYVVTVSESGSVSTPASITVTSH
jgi:YVTN family beta-propeller protein